MPNNTHSQADKPCIHHISRRAALARGATAVAGVVLAPGLFAAPDKRKVVVWSEGTTSVDPESKSVYPKDINFAIAEGLKPLEGQGWEIVMASLNDPDQGISDERLKTVSDHVRQWAFGPRIALEITSE